MSETAHFRATMDPYPVKLEITQWGAEQIQSAIFTVRELHPNSELSVTLDWLRTALLWAGVNGYTKLDSTTQERPLSPL